jgi:hypothetical protein
MGQTPSRIGFKTSSPKRSILATVLVGLLTINPHFGSAGIVSAADPVDESTESPFGNVQGLDDQAIRRAVTAGVRHLLTLQHNDGSIHDRGHETAMTALAVMAMASIGVLPSDPSGESLAMRRAVDYVVNPNAPVRSPRQDAQGYFGRGDGSRM